ncbi:MAG: alkaline phosphatase family protein [Actinomycetota bacterium]|nr:alkaline phosphatase family protein [Actinomycetota bacterium]
MNAKSLILIVIDGLTPWMFESAVTEERAPTLSFLVDQGSYAVATSTFPSLTPVCLSSIATGAHPDVHGIPHLVWWNAAERRVVEYGSSYAAVRAAGLGRSLRDTVLNLNQRHLSPDAVTVYEVLEDAGLTAAAINITCYRGRTRHAAIIPGVPPAFGPKRFFFYNLYSSDVTGAPLAIRNRAAGSIDAYAAAVGRWLVTRDGFDFLVYYLPDYDFASHLSGPDAAYEALARSDQAVGTLMEAAGGPEEFLERYAVILCSDHGQTKVTEPARLQASFGQVPGTIVTASNRAGMVYRLDATAPPARELAERLDGEAAAETVLFHEDDWAVARRDGVDLRFRPRDERWDLIGDEAILADYPDGLERAWAALANPNAGDVIVSAAPGYEFLDLGGRHHLGGGSHGSLSAGDSLVPMVVVGLDRLPASITEIAPLALEHFGVEPPPYARRLARAA